MVAMVESISSFAPTKTPMAALHHKVAPVFNPFTLPFSLTDLADYLNVDRSAMMRELKLLKEDGLVEKIGNRIILLYE